jgi:hypothetical protein
VAVCKGFLAILFPDPGSTQLIYILGLSSNRSRNGQPAVPTITDMSATTVKLFLRSPMSHLEMVGKALVEPIVSVLSYCFEPMRDGAKSLALL